MDCIVHGILQARILEWVAFPLLQGIFPTQGPNPGLPHCRRILYQLSHQGSPDVQMAGVDSERLGGVISVKDDLEGGYHLLVQ